jgi:hypothetical protein
MIRSKRNLILLVLILLASALTPVVHDLIKPYRLRVELTFRHESPTDSEVYFSTSRKNPTYVRSHDVAPFVTPTEDRNTNGLSRLVAYIAARKPVTGLRLDPSNNNNQITIESLSVHSLFSEGKFNSKEIESFLKTGEGISNLRATDTRLQFDTTGNDAHFSVPLPPEITIPTRFEAAIWYVVSWLIAMGMLLLLKISVFAPHAKLNNNGALPIRIGKARIYLPTISARIYNLLGICLLGYTMVQFIGLTVGMDFSHVQKAFDKDRISEAIPPEVFWIKALVNRQGIETFVLAGDLGRGEDESMVFQRATEYLYPTKVVAHSKWVFARADDQETATRPDCKPRDRQEGITLYACEK